MNNFSADDINMLYWHAVTKMRQGCFHSAHQFFRYVMEIDPSFERGLAMAYCAMRNGDKALAKENLQAVAALAGNDPRAMRFYHRLEKRVSQ